MQYQYQYQYQVQSSNNYLTETFTSFILASNIF